MKGVNFGSEPHLITISEEVTISFGVSFITHDGATWVFRDIIGDLTKIAPINVGKRSFIGANIIVLPGVTIGSRCVIAAGSVLTKSVPDSEVWGGVPAKKIMSVDQYISKCTLNYEK